MDKVANKIKKDKSINSKIEQKRKDSLVSNNSRKQTFSIKMFSGKSEMIKTISDQCNLLDDTKTTEIQ